MLSSEQMASSIVQSCVHLLADQCSVYSTSFQPLIHLLSRFPFIRRLYKMARITVPRSVRVSLRIREYNTEYKTALTSISAEHSQLRIAIPVTNFINVRQLYLHKLRNKDNQIKSLTELFVIYMHWNISDLMQNNLKFLVPSLSSPDSSTQVYPNLSYVVPVIS
jgi:hypothetical protein